MRSSILANFVELEEESPPAGETQEVEEIRYSRTKRKTRESKEESYDHIPVEKTVVIEPEEVKNKPEAYEKIAEERSFQVGIHPPKLYRIETIRPKYQPKDNKDTAPIVAPAPQHPVQGLAHVSLLTHIVLSKYMDHLPLYRQQKIFKRYGAQISRQNMGNWVNQVAELLKPIYNHMRMELLSGNYLQIDETPIKVLDPDSEQKKIRQGWLWPISRPGGDVVFSWSVTRSGSHLDEWIRGFNGYLQSDAYAVYNKYIKENEGVLGLGCFAHARRRFKEAQHEGERPLKILQQISALYAIEKKLREESAAEEQIKEERQNHAKPILNELYERILETRREVLPQSLTGKACEYSLGQWKTLSRYTEEGYLQIDNNLIENAIRPSAIGKKNWLFIGHPRAGERSAIIYSILISCQRHKVDINEYLNDVLTQTPYLINRDQSHLTPKNWKQRND